MLELDLDKLDQFTDYSISHDVALHEARKGGFMHVTKMHDMLCAYLPRSA